MPQVPSSAVTVTWAADTAVVIVRGELDPLTASQARERIASLIGNGLRRLVLNLVDVSDRAGADCLALIAIARYLLPPDCVLDVCSASPDVLRVLALAGWSRPDSAARPCQVIRPGSSECSILGRPLAAIRCPGPARPAGPG